jgi:hypothetical protein
MEIILTIPIGKCKTVAPKILTAKLVKLMGKREFILDGSMPGKVLSAISNLTEEEAGKLTVLDSRRILMASYYLTYGSNEWLAAINCECGCRNTILHKLEWDKTGQSALYQKEHSVKGPSEDGIKDFKVKVAPLRLKLEGELFKAVVSDNSDEYKELLLWAQIESIDGKKDYDKDEVPLPVYKAIRALVDEDTSSTISSYQIEAKCVKCGKGIISDISWGNINFLSGN